MYNPRAIGEFDAGQYSINVDGEVKMTYKTNDDTIILLDLIENKPAPCDDTFSNCMNRNDRYIAGCVIQKIQKQ